MLDRALSLMLMLFILPTPLLATDIPVTGRVLGPEGEPRPKIEVTLEAISPTYERARLRFLGDVGPEAVTRTRTRTDGTFELSAPEAGMWKVVVTAPGALTMEFRLDPLANPAALPALRLVPMADLEVRMVDAAGKPLSGQIGAYTLGTRNGAWRPQLRLARTDDSGVAHLPLGHDEKVQLELLADGHPLQVYELFDESSVEFAVPKGIVSTVRITDQQKRPLPGALAFQGSALLPLGLADEEGHLAVVLASKDAPPLEVMTEDFWSGSFAFDLANSSAPPQNLQLDPPTTLSGRVLDLSSREPVAEALVWAVRGELTRTDKEGRYDVRVGGTTSRWIQAVATGYQKGTSQVSEGSEEVPTIGLSPATSLSGRVLNEEGKRLAGVVVEVATSPTRGSLSRAVQSLGGDDLRSRTSSRGTFHIRGLVSGVGYRLTFKAAGFAPLTLDIDPLEPFENKSGIEAVLRPGLVAVGMVVDEDDVPVAGAEVGLKASPKTGDLMTSMMRRSADDGVEDPLFLTNKEGRFEIADLEVGRYDLAVRATGYAPTTVPGVRVEQEGGRTDFGTVVLVPGASIEGRVTTADGAAVVDAEVIAQGGGQGFMALSNAGGPRGQTTTDSTGRFIIADLLPGQPVTLTVGKKGYGSEAVSELRPPTEEPVIIVLQPTGRLQGQVVDTQGDPVEGATVQAQPDFRSMTSVSQMQSFRPTWARTDADGHFLIEDVQPGTLQVTAHAEAYQQQVRSGVEIAAGKDHELDFVLETGAVVEGTVRTTDGESVGKASIRITQQQSGARLGFGGNLSGGSGQSDIEGRYRIEGLPLGPASIMVSNPQRQRLEKAVDIRPGTNIVDLVLEPGYEVSGQVVGPDGTPMGGAEVSIQKAAQPGLTNFSIGTEQELSRADGTFTLTGVSAGEHTVKASREGYAPTTSDTFEVVGDVAGLVLELRRGATLKGHIVGLEFDELSSLTLVAFSAAGGMRQGKADFSAEYAFPNLAPGQWHVQAQAGGSGRMSSLQVEIPEGVPEVEQDIEFGAGLTLSGMVLDGGQPLVGALISANGSVNRGQGSTDSDGRFRIEGLKEGSYQVMVMSGLGIQHMEALELTDDHELQIEISTGSISGTVLDTTHGEPLAGAIITLEQLDPAENPALLQLGLGNQAESDSQGYFKVPQVRQGNWRAVSSKPGYTPGEATVAVAGGATPEIELRMSPTEGVTFEVALESGAAVPSVQVTTLAPSGRRIATSTHPVVDGKVRVSTVPPGRWELVIQGGDSAATRFFVQSPGDQGRFVLPTGGVLLIKVPELEQEPMVRVELSGPDGRPFLSTLGITLAPGEWLMGAGQSMIPGLVAGTWSFTVKHPDGRTWSGSATVTAGTTTEVSLP